MNRFLLDMCALWILVVFCCFKESFSSVLSHNPSRIFRALSPIDAWLKKCPPRAGCPDIPKQCRRTYIYWNKGYLCRGCDKKKPNCKKAIQVNSVSGTCPKPTDCIKVPQHCAMPVYFWIQEKRCRGCDMRLPGCSEVIHPIEPSPSVGITRTLGSY